ncbi:hypothetical protein ACTQWG_03960 [Blautia sp. HCP3S3_H10_1]|uniref:hypothetical protein n=1 Tax=unclassified Blautia TaxID=2648079 RepID=UPI003F911347|nr:hypothetical protein [Clostridia bacterium]
MKKSNFTALILGTIGMVFFALGMCMALIEEWGMFRQGIVSGVIGLVVLLLTLIVWRKMEGKAPIKLSGKTVGTVILAVFGALILGVGMSLCMVFGKMVLGVVVGLVGIVALLMLIPMTKGLK